VLDKIALPYTIDADGYFERSGISSPCFKRWSWPSFFLLRTYCYLTGLLTITSLISNENKRKVLKPFELAD